MKTTEYKGIDYGLGQSNIDKETGIRFGVISQHSVMSEALDDIMTHGKDVAWESAVKEIEEEIKASEMDEEDKADEIEDRINDLSNCWETNLGNYLYEQDGYKLTGCLDNDLFVIKSPFYTYAQFCSPCVPGAGNLDNPCSDGPKTYCLGHDWFDDGQAPYLVFSVETNEEVKP